MLHSGEWPTTASTVAATSATATTFALDRKKIALTQDTRGNQAATRGRNHPWKRNRSRGPRMKASPADHFLSSAIALTGLRGSPRWGSKRNYKKNYHHCKDANYIYWFQIKSLRRCKYSIDNYNKYIWCIFLAMQFPHLLCNQLLNFNKHIIWFISYRQA